MAHTQKACFRALQTHLSKVKVKYWKEVKW